MTLWMCPGHSCPIPAPPQDPAASQDVWTHPLEHKLIPWPWLAWGCSEGGNWAGSRLCREELSPEVPCPLSQHELH